MREIFRIYYTYFFILIFIDIVLTKKKKHFFTILILKIKFNIVIINKSFKLSNVQNI